MMERQSSKTHKTDRFSDPSGFAPASPTVREQHEVRKKLFQTRKRDKFAMREGF